jgi:hypothetical protein
MKEKIGISLNGDNFGFDSNSDSAHVSVFDHNFLLKYRIEMIQTAVESLFKMIQFIVK